MKPGGENEFDLPLSRDKVETHMKPINEPFTARRLKHSNDSITGACLFWGLALLFTTWLVTHIARSDSPAFQDIREIKDRVYAALSGEAK